MHWFESFRGKRLNALQFTLPSEFNFSGMYTMVYFLVAIICILLVYHINSIQFHKRKLPPGPFVAPFGLGVLPHLILINPRNTWQLVASQWEFARSSLQDRYGDFMSFEFAGFVCAIISSYEMLQEVANVEAYSNKVCIEGLTTMRTFDKELGLMFVSKPQIWMEMRKFTQRTLREFGFGKRHTMQGAIEAEISVLVKHLNEAIQNEDGIIKIKTTFSISLLNILWCMVTGNRYDHNDTVLIEMLERHFSMSRSTTISNPFQFAILFFRKVLPFFIGGDSKTPFFNEIHKFTEKLIRDRKLKGVYTTCPENFVDAFLQKIDSIKEVNADETYTVEQLQSILLDLFQAGFLTTDGTLKYALLYLLLNPTVQVKCQEEIDEIVPSHLTPTLDDIVKMPYFQATILETHRLANVVPVPVPRLVPRECNIRGYTIPKGTIIAANHYSIHLDKKYWGDPEIFRPERFLNKKGEFCKDKHVVHFGAGKRICPGIALVDSIIPIFVASLLQKFNISMVPGTKPPTTEPDVGLTLSPKEYSLLVTSRKK